MWFVRESTGIMKAERRLSANRIRQKTDSEREVDMKETGGDNKKKRLIGYYKTEQCGLLFS